MPKQEGLGQSSPEQLKAFTKAVSKEESLIFEREKSLGNVLETELDIAKKREQALTNYFDLYSQKLESLKTSNEKLLDDTFTVLNKKLTDRYKTLSSEIDKLEQRLSGTSGTSKENSGVSSPAHRKHKPSASTGNSASVDNNIIQALQQFAKAWNGFQNNSMSSKGNSSTSNNSAAGEYRRLVTTEDHYRPAEQITPDDTLKELETPSAEELNGKLDGWRKFFQQTEEERRKAIQEGTELLNFGQKAIDDAYNTKREKALIDQANQVEKIQNRIIELEVAAKEKEAGLVDQQTQIRLDSLQAAQEAELEAAKVRNEIAAQIKLAQNPELNTEVASNRARELSAKDETASMQEQAKKQADYIAKEELQARLKYSGKELEQRLANIKKEAADKFKFDKETLDKLTKARLAQEEKEKKRAEDREKRAKAQYGKITALGADSFKDYSVAERFADLRDMRNNIINDRMANGDNEDAAKLAAGLQVMTGVLSSLAQELESKVDSIASYKSFIDTRLQGSNNDKVLFSYWDRLTKDMMKVGAVTPFFKQEKFAENIKTLVDTGIAFDLKQRAFLMTIQEKIANTFDVADGTLLRLIRIQQQDSTAGRLGMESALNSFLNNMYENTEYLKTVASGVRQSLQEMEALMTGAEATEVEYQVQKWMGSLYSVGMSQEAVNSIANALGQIAAGQVDALTGGGAGNLMVMAANEAGIPIADILTSGLDAKETNKLLQATVNYLADIAASSKDNRVVQQQLANVFGVKASDLRAATNLATGDTMQDIYGEQLTYDNMLRQLYKMASTMGVRTSMGEMMTNVWDNVQYSLAGSMASSPVSYLLYKVAGLLESTTGGIDIGLPMVMGNGLPVQFKVSDLMRAGAMAGGILGSLGSLISGLVNSGSGALMLASMGIDFGSGLKVTPRGSGGVGAVAGDGAQTTSSSGYVGNASGSDVKNSTIQQNEDDAKKQMIEAKEEAEATQIDFINTNVLKIYELLDEVTSGKRNFNVKVSGYGLTRTNYSNYLVGAQGGLGGLLSNSPANNGSDMLNSGFDVESTGATSGGLDSGSVSGSSSSVNSTFGGAGVSLSGWKMA